MSSPSLTHRLCALISRLIAQNDRHLLDHPTASPRLWLRFGLRYVICLAGLYGVVAHPWDPNHGVLHHPLTIAIAVVLVGLAANGSLSVTLRRARAYREGWLDGRHELLHQLPPLLSGRVARAQWHRQQMARELEALGMEPNEIFCHLNRLDDMADGHGR